VATDPLGAPPRRPARRSLKAYLYVAPAFLVFAAFLGAPVVQTVQYSFYDWDGMGRSTAAGLSNYVAVFTDDRLRDSFLHAGVLMLFYAAAPVLLALFLSALISRAHAMRSMSFFRTVLFLPQVIATVVIATIWVSIYSRDGLLNQTLRLVGLDSLSRVWLGDHTFALVAIGVVGTWLNIGLCLVLFLSGIGNIAPELFEAARLDGAGRVREFVAITLPSLRGQIAVALTLTVVSALKTFDLVFITTRGGPGNATSVPAFEAYNRAFNTGQVGLASAIAVVLTVVIVVLTVSISRIAPRESE
jgi:raffinose/stachyose/melibiose transport system permease protein